MKIIVKIFGRMAILGSFWILVNTTYYSLHKHVIGIEPPNLEWTLWAFSIGVLVLTLIEEVDP